MNVTAEKKEQVLEQLKGWLKPGDTIYTILRSRSKSGMQRTIDLVIFRDDRPLHLNSACVALGAATRLNKAGEVVVSGCGFDAGDHVVEQMSYALFGKSRLKQEWI